MNVNALLGELLETDARMAALKSRRDELRKVLAAEATKRYDEDKAVPSWKVPRLGSATLAGTESTETDVVDQAAFAAWVRDDRPESVTFELAIPASAVDDHAEALAALEGAPGVSQTWRVHPGVLPGIVAMGRPDPESGRLMAQDGQIVPGVVVRPKEPYLTVRLNAEAKRRALAQLAGETERALVEAEDVGHRGRCCEIAETAAETERAYVTAEFEPALQSWVAAEHLPVEEGGIERVPDDVADAIAESLAAPTDDYRSAYTPPSGGPFGDLVADVVAQIPEEAIEAQEAVGSGGPPEEVPRPLVSGSPEWYAALDDVFGPA